MSYMLKATYYKINDFSMQAKAIPTSYTLKATHYEITPYKRDLNELQVKGYIL